MKYIFCSIVLIICAVHVNAAESLESQRLAKLKEVARIGSILLDGDACQKIVTPRAEELMVKKHPDDRWFGSDNYDVHLAEFTRQKQLLKRMAKLVDFKTDCNLIMKTKKPGKIHMVIRQLNNMYRYYTFGQLETDPPKELVPVLEKGETVVVKHPKRKIISVFAPVKNSMNEVVGMIEVCGSIEE